MSNSLIEKHLQWIYPEDCVVNILTKCDGKVTGESYESVDAAVEKATKLSTLPQTDALWVSVHKPKATAWGFKWKAVDMAAYQFLCIDVDNIPSMTGYCATDQERQLCKTKAEKIESDLCGQGLPKPAVVFTGNGYLLLFPIDLPATEDNHVTLTKVAAVMDAVYTDSHCKIDKGVITDPCKILGVVGTLNRNKPESVENNRVAKVRQFVGELPKREPMSAEAFLEWATQFTSTYYAIHDIHGISSTEPQCDFKASEIVPSPTTLKPLDGCRAALLKAATNYAIKGARDFPAIQGDAGDEQTFRVAGLIMAHTCQHGAKLTIEDVEAIMLEHYNPACAPPWEPADLAVKIKSAATNGTSRLPKIIKCEREIDVDEWVLKAPETAEKTTTPTPMEVYDGAVIPQDVIEFPLGKFPQPIQSFVSDLAAGTKMIAPIYHMAAAYATIGSLIGKVMFAEEERTYQYPNDWFVCLCPTGSAKTGALTAIQDELLNLDIGMVIGGGTMAGMYHEIGRSVGAKQWVKLTDFEQTEKKKQFRDEAKARLGGYIILADECTGTLNTLMGGWDSRSPAKDLADLIKLTDSAQRIPRPLGGDGYKVIEDTCVSFLGYTQNETWANKFGGDDFKSCGLFGRFLPITSRYLRLTGVGRPSTSFRSILAQIHAKSRDVGQRVRCTFLAEDGSDAIAPAMDYLLTCGVGSQLRRIFPADWDKIRSKIVVHAMKCSMVDAFVNDDHLDGLNVKESVDCTPYFKIHAAWITGAYLAYFQQIDVESASAKHEKSILQIIRQHRVISQRDLLRKLHMKKWEFEDAINGLLSDGSVVAEARVSNRNGVKTKVYKIAV